MNIFRYIIPIDLSTPYSQIASVTFWVVDTKRRKNEIVRAIPAMIATKMLKITDVD